MDNGTANETEAERKKRRAAEARAAVAKVWPELLDGSGVDTTLFEETLALTVLDRLRAAYQFELAKKWLRELPRVRTPKDR